MTFTHVLFLLVCGIGALNSVFLAVYVALRPKGQRALNLTFAALVGTFSLRISKAVWVFFISEVHPTFEVLWMLAFLLMPVIFFAYALQLRGIGSLSGRLGLAGGAVVGIAAGVVLVGQSLFAGLVLATGVALAASAPAVRALRRQPLGRDPLSARWLTALGTFCAGTWAIYAAYVGVRMWRPVHETVAFNAEAVIVSVAVYALMFVELRIGLIGRVHQVRSRQDVDHDVAVRHRLERLMEVERVYLDPSLTLPVLARTLRLSPQQVSRVLNATMGVGFNDYINRLRVEEACRLIGDAEGATRKISSVAFECGFNSASVFYTAFRKFTGKTPTEYLQERSHT